MEDTLKKGQKQKDALTRRESRNLWESPEKNAGGWEVRRRKDGVNFCTLSGSGGIFGKSGI